MDYLRRLHPRQAGRADAAVPDLGAWRLAGMPPGGDASLDAASRPSLLPPAATEPAFSLANTALAVEPLARAGATVREVHAPPRAAAAAGLAAIETSHATPAATAHATAAAAKPTDRRGAAAPLLPPQAPHSATSPRLAVDAKAARALPQPSSPNTAVPPLRGDARALAARDHAADMAVPPVVHVSIDRIDVRIPAAPAPTAAARRPRAESSVGALTDYLRGDGRQRQ